MVNPNKTLVLLFDGLGAKYLDPYGQSDFRHNAINRLAAESILFENLVANSVDAIDVAKSMFGNDENSIFHFLNSSGLKSEVIVDSASLRLCYPVRFVDQITIIEHEDCNKVAESFEETELACTFAQIIDLVNRSSADFICVHCSSLTRTWDAPIDERLSGVGDEDPDLEPFFVAPEQNANWREDPDQYLQWLTAYQAQIRIVDQCISILLSEFASAAPAATIVLTSTSGYSLGEHGYVGARPASPFVEAIHLPLIVKVPSMQLEATRWQPLIKPVSVNELLHLMQVEQCSSESMASFFEQKKTENQIVVSHGVDNSMSIRTDCWSFVEKSGQPALYVRPDDLWEVNNVIDRCPSVGEAMTNLKEQLASGQESAELPGVIFERF